MWHHTPIILFPSSLITLRQGCARGCTQDVPLLIGTELAINTSPCNPIKLFKRYILLVASFG